MPTNKNNTKHRKKMMIQALGKTLGVVTYAADMVGISRMMHYQWMNSDPNYKKEVDDIECAGLDLAEHKLLKLINDENVTAIIFYLKTKGKHRGYIERNEITGKDG